MGADTRRLEWYAEASPDGNAGSAGTRLAPGSLSAGADRPCQRSKPGGPRLAQTRPGARGALLFYSCVPTSAFGSAWPADVPVQIHGMDADPFFVGEGDIDAAHAIVESAPAAELFLYPGDQHYFADSSLPSYRPDAAALLRQRVLAFLATR